MRHLTRLVLFLCLLAIAAIPALAEQIRVIPKGSVTIPAGGTTADVKVVINGDTTVEPDESYTVTISSPTLQIGTATATGTIINDDGIVAPVLSVTAPTRVKNGTVANFTVSRSGDKAKADKVRWAVVPLGATPVAEDDFPAVLEDEFSGSTLGSEWCAADGSIADYEAPDGCPGIPEDAQLGTWDADRVSVSGGSLRLSIDHDTGTWTSAQVFSKRAFRGGLLKYAVNYPAGKGGAHSVWRAPEDGYYGPGPRSGQIVDSFYLGKTSGDRNKTWLSQLQYSGPDSDAYPAIAGLLNDGTTWSGSSRAASTRWRVGTDGVTRFAFQVGNTEYWAPVQGDWPATQPWTRQDADEIGNPVFTDFPGGGPASPFDRPFRLVLQAGVGDADSPACTGEESCPDTSTLDGATVLVDYIRYYQYPTGEAVIQPGQDQIIIPVQTRDASVAGVRNFRFVMLDADEATVSAANGTADVALDPAGDVGVNHGKETYFLDFGSGAGGFTDSFGTTWENGNGFVTGGTAKNDVVTVPGGGTAVGSWTTALEDPPEMVDPLIITDKCPGETGWPTGAQAAGKDVKIILPTDRDCTFAAHPENQVSDLHFLQGTQSNPARNFWLIGGKIQAPGPSPQTDPGTMSWPNGMTARFVKGTIYWEGAHIDMRCTCRDAFATANLGHYENGARLTGNQPANKTPRVVFVNSILENPLQCTKDPSIHGDVIHMQGTGTRGEVKLQNVVFRHGFQGLFLDNSTHQPAGHGATRIELDHVQVYKRTDVACQRTEGKAGTTGSVMWNIAPRDGVWFYDTWMVPGATTNPGTSGFTSAKCATYASTAGVRTSGWCQGTNPKGDPVTPATVGRNYDRDYFLGAGGGSTEPPEIAGARVPKLDHTRLTGSSMAIAIPVNTLRGRQRVVTLGFSARDETAVGQRIFSIAGNIIRSNFDIYANAGARDTETRITAPVTVGDDGILRLTLTGVTGEAQINWMSIQRPTVSVTLDKTIYNEGDTITATLRRSGPTEPSVSMGWQVLGAGDAPTTGSDFDPQSPSGTAFWSSGDVDKLVTVKAVADGTGEPQEGFVFALSGGVGADIDPALSSVQASIAASTGPGDPCAPGGALYPCDTGGGGGEEPPPTDVCRPVGAVQGKPINVEYGKAIAVRKTHLVSGMRGIVRGLQTKCAKSTVCYGRDACLDPKGLQEDVPSTAFVRIDTAGRFPDLQPGKRVVDNFVYQVCAPPLFTSCTPVIADVIVSAPRSPTYEPPPPPADTEAPTTPTDLSASAASSSQINLTWTAATDNVGVTGYRVLRCQGVGCTPTTVAAIPSGTSYSNIGLAADTVYGFRVVARDAAQNFSAPTSTVYETTDDAGPVWADEFDTFSVGLTAPAVWYPWFKEWDVHALDGNSDKGWKDLDESVWDADGGGGLSIKQIIEAFDPAPATKARYLHEVSDGTLKLRCYPNGIPERDEIWEYSHSCGMISSELVPERAAATGYWEFRMKIDSLTKGQHLAAWLVPQNGAWPPEIDAGEWVHSAGAETVARHNMNIHGETVTAPMTYDDPVPDPNGWHTYGLEITADTINWYRDGVLRRTGPNRFTTDELDDEPAQPLAFMISPEHSGNWPGLPDETTVYPFETEIDYVRYYSAKP